ncbi:hypothetical protein CMI37_12820 [Candidatus Pacearchaeota archaeon]|jgi:hypothetical protein|nr:hypothetical protein [Candidatus Pacearchaeota archaeon]|tara:strand:- start:8795 stop:9121 length:327 start_codon:yes stop_codon:yes gene_type:complete
MLLIIFALILLILLITIPIIWKLFISVLSFLITAPFKIIAVVCDDIWNGNVRNRRKDPFWTYAANDSTAMWVKGTDGRFFRYGLNLSDEAEVHQMEEFNEFYRNHMDG